MAVRAVIFDFGGVLCFFPSEAKIQHLARKLGVSVPVFLEAFWKDRLDYDAGMVTPKQYWHGVAHTAGIAIDDAALPELIALEVDFWNHYDSRVFDWIGKLRAAGLRIGLLSNLPLPLGEALRATPGFLDPFDHVTYSYELKLVKPQREIYEHSVVGVGIAAGETVFLDDKIANVEGARGAGLLAVEYASWEDFLASGEIDRLGLPRP